MHEICQAALNGDLATAEQLNAQIDILHSVLFCESNPIPVKWALYVMGQIQRGIRLPLTVLAESYQPLITQALRDTQLIGR